MGLLVWVDIPAFLKWELMSPDLEIGDFIEKFRFLGEIEPGFRFNLGKCFQV